MAGNSQAQEDGAREGARERYRQLVRVVLVSSLLSCLLMAVFAERLANCRIACKSMFVSGATARSASQSAWPAADWMSRERQRTGRASRLPATEPGSRLRVAARWIWQPPAAALRRWRRGIAAVPRQQARHVVVDRQVVFLRRRLADARSRRRDARRGGLPGFFRGVLCGAGLSRGGLLAGGIDVEARPPQNLRQIDRTVLLWLRRRHGGIVRRAACDRRLGKFLRIGRGGFRAAFIGIGGAPAKWVGFRLRRRWCSI